MLDRKLMLPHFTLTEILTAAQIEVEFAAGAPSRPEPEAQDGACAVTMPDPLRLKGLMGIDSWALINPDGPLWFRGYATLVLGFGRRAGEESSKHRYKVAHFVVGHTVHGSQAYYTALRRAVFLIDTGMLSSHFTGGRASALEIQAGQFTAIYPEERRSSSRRANVSRLPCATLITRPDCRAARRASLILRIEPLDDFVPPLQDGFAFSSSTMTLGRPW